VGRARRSDFVDGKRRRQTRRSFNIIAR
jgi:hypothetical protein